MNTTYLFLVIEWGIVIDFTIDYETLCIQLKLKRVKISLVMNFTQLTNHLVSFPTKSCKIYFVTVHYLC